MGTRIAILAGATGLVGQEILHRLVDDDQVNEVHCIVRRPMQSTNAKVKQHLISSREPLALPKANELYLALGTTIKVAGSRAAFRHIDYDMSLRIAELAVAAGVTQIGLVSSVGSNLSSPNFYLRTKGELEEALSKLLLKGMVIARPSLLLGDRAKLNQPLRMGERIGQLVASSMGPALPKRYRPIKATDVATALCTHTPRARGLIVKSSAEMQP